MGEGLERRTAKQQRRARIAVDQTGGEAVHPMGPVADPVAVLVPAQIVTPMVAPTGLPPDLVLGPDVEDLLSVSADDVALDAIAPGAGPAGRDDRG